MLIRHNDEVNDFNDTVIAEFRANHGRVGGPFEGAPLLLLHSTGAKTGAPRVHPMMYQAVGQSFAVFASKAGAPDNPDWYHNLVANPEASAEVGTDTIAVRARVAEGAERDELWERQKTAYPQFQGYEDATDRVIPVVVLERT